MEQLFKTKIRRVGTSLGVLIPKKLISRQKIRTGEEVEIAILEKKKIELIEKAFGIAKGAASFKRTNADRL